MGFSYALYVLCQTLYYLIFYRIKDNDLHYVVCNVNIANFWVDLNEDFKVGPIGNKHV